MLKKFLKNEKGSITLFVVVSILFFLIVVFSMFMTSSNKSRIQTSEIDKIKEEYQESVQNIDQIYQDTLNNNITNLLKIGDYVNYTYDTLSAGYSLLATESGYDSNQTIPQTTGLKWRILNIHEDGTIDLISETATSTDVYFQGALGYNNAVLLINDICAKQYSNKELGITARSVNLEDIESQMNETGIAARNAFNNGIASYGETKTYTGDIANYPNLYAKENGSGINTTTTKTNGISAEDAGYTIPTDETSTKADSLTITQSYYRGTQQNSFFDNSQVYDIIYGTEMNYWLASRYVGCYSSNAGFGALHVNTTNLDAYAMFSSRGIVYSPGYRLRPVVSLNINQIQASTGIADGTDATIEHMHQIKE